jgi:glycosyltransferase involved in cell wall biosynthesis
LLDLLKKQVKGTLRRAKDAFLPSREVRAYERWIRERIAARKAIYTREPAPGLFSILTAVWDGSPLAYLRELAESIRVQNQAGAVEWVVLDNGCRGAELASYLDQLAQLAWVRLVRAERNLGITRGLRRCLEEARGRYVLPVDADDRIDADALRVVATAVEENGYPGLLYTDEDKVIGKRRYQPYSKPDWDPVLLLNSAYIAHLGVIDREKALVLGAYSDPAAEGSPDWDLFVRFLIAGERAVHVPEVVYSWRVHASSTADDDASKTYIANSQRAVLQRFLDSRAEGKLFALEPSPLFAGGAHWHFRRKPVGMPGVGLARGEEISEWAKAAASNSLVALIGSDIELSGENWQWEAVGIFELHPDAVMVAGRIRDESGVLLEAGLELDAQGNVLNPHRGKLTSDPGYFGQLWKPRTVGTASARLVIVRSELLRNHLGEIRSSEEFAARAGAIARQRGWRVVYSPFIEGLCRSGLDNIS